MKKTLLLLSTLALALGAAADYLELELRPGEPAAVNHAAVLRQVQFVGGAANSSGMSVSLVRGAATNQLCTSLSATAGKLSQTACTNALVALPGDALLLLPTNAAPARATAVLQR